MGNCASNDGSIPHVTAMRVLGTLIILLSIAEFGVGGAVYGFLTNVHLGAWWGGICTFVAGALGVASSNKGVVIAACVFSIIGAIVAAVGSIVDGISSGVLAYEKGCINTNTFELWGSSEGKMYAAECVFGYYFYNGYSNNNFYYYNGLTNQCVCADKTVCYGYDLATGDNCGLILTKYTSLLATSTTIVSILAVVTFVFSILTCIGACSPSTGYNSTSAPPPVVQTVQMASPQAAPYAIQPGAPMVYASVPPGTAGAYPTYVGAYPGQPQVVYAAVPAQQQPPIVYAMAPVEQKAMLGATPI